MVGERFVIVIEIDVRGVGLRMTEWLNKKTEGFPKNKIDGQRGVDPRQAMMTDVDLNHI